MPNLWRANLNVQVLADQEDQTVGEEDFQALYFLKQNSNSKGRFAFMKSRNTSKFKEITNSDRKWKDHYAMGRGPVDSEGYPWITLLVLRLLGASS